ncbi:MAG: hypothetical protein RL430_647 [Actinomycetota bacterium]|jgi:hypothetical protein
MAIEQHSADNVPVLMISCDTCVAINTEACTDCMMNSLCDNDQGAVILSLQDLREVRLLAKAGLVPTLRHRAVG